MAWFVLCAFKNDILFYMAVAGGNVIMRGLVELAALRPIE